MTSRERSAAQRSWSCVPVAVSSDGSVAAETAAWHFATESANAVVSAWAELGAALPPPHETSAMASAIPAAVRNIATSFFLESGPAGARTQDLAIMSRML